MFLIKMSIFFYLLSHTVFITLVSKFVHIVDLKFQGNILIVES